MDDLLAMRDKIVRARDALGSRPATPDVQTLIDCIPVLDEVISKMECNDRLELAVAEQRERIERLMATLLKMPTFRGTA